MGQNASKKGPEETSLGKMLCGFFFKDLRIIYRGEKFGK
jgi:hypothetical protein